MRKELHDILKQLNQDLIVVDVGAPQGAQLNHDLIVYVRHMGKAFHDAIEQLHQDLIFLDVGGCQGAGPGQLTQELIFFNSWINCLPRETLHFLCNNGFRVGMLEVNNCVRRLLGLL